MYMHMHIYTLSFRETVDVTIQVACAYCRVLRGLGFL